MSTDLDSEYWILAPTGEWDALSFQLSSINIDDKWRLPSERFVNEDVLYDWAVTHHSET
ncbi:2954_t:CDS:2 [Scutellospora calospora]|uniref:2954_t:CDS:1 n=1 Tax=Scutellospora calospora TaxID=85575 RepID=A0ACA9KAB7_9GLOM|nr:2954_t:CDS:2 [Scutellospora calospora]